MDIHNIKKHKNLFIVGSFLIISFLCLSLIILTGNLSMTGDAQFNWQRVNEIKNSINSLMFFPGLANHYFSGIGSAIMTMVPSITLIPFVFILYFINTPIYFFYIFFYLCFFLSMIIAYFASYYFNNNRKISYLFAVIYGILSNNLFVQMNFGLQLSIVFLPLAIFGLLSFFKNGKWIELSMGISLIVLTNGAVAFAISIVFIIWILCNYRNISKSKLLNLSKALALLLLSSSIYWLPAIKLFLMNQLIQPTNTRMSGVGVDVIIKKALLPSIYVGDSQSVDLTVNIIAFLTIFLGGWYFKKLNQIDRQIYLAGIISIVLYSGLFPWSILSSTFFNLLESPSYLYVIPQLLLNYLFAVIFIKHFTFKNNEFNRIGLALLACLFFQIIVQRQYVSQYIETSQSTINIQNSVNGTITSTQSFESNDDTDYYPSQSADQNVNNYIIYNSNSVINDVKFENEGNGYFMFNNPHRDKKEMVVPYLFYRGVNYNVTVDGKIVDVSHDQNYLLKISNLTKRSGNIQVKYNFGLIKIIALICSLIGLLAYIYLLLISNRNRI